MFLQRPIFTANSSNEIYAIASEGNSNKGENGKMPTNKWHELKKLAPAYRTNTRASRESINPLLSDGVGILKHLLS